VVMVMKKNLPESKSQMKMRKLIARSDIDNLSKYFRINYKVEITEEEYVALESADPSSCSNFHRMSFRGSCMLKTYFNSKSWI
jgi:hypothetical protein